MVTEMTDGMQRKMFIKLCGMMSEEDVRTAAVLSPDYIGCILSDGFRRTVSSDDVSRWKSVVPAGITLTGVFVDDDPDRIAGLVKEGVIDAVQLHGGEDESYILSLRAKLSQTGTKHEIIKAFRIRSAEDVESAARSPADRILLDGGTGEGMSFNWKLIGEMKRPYILAGGLTADNVLEAIKTLHPGGVDVSSGIEKDGKKDPNLMRRFVEEVNSAFL